MNILYVPSKDPRLTSCGNEQRTNLLWESLKKYGKVYTFLVDYQLTSREEMYNGNNPIFKFNPVIKKWSIWYLVNSILVRFSLFSIYDYKSKRIPNPAEVFKNIHFDVVVTRYVVSTCSFKYWEIAPLFIDIDDHPLQVYSSIRKRQLPKILQKLGECITKWQTRQILSRSIGGWIANEEQVVICPNNYRFLPNIPQSPSTSYRVDYGERRNLFTVGAMGYGPNKEGVTRFLKEIWSTFHMVYPDVKYYIVGGGALEADVEKWNSYEGVEYLGFVEDLESLYEKTLATVVPVYSGAGTCIKTLESISFSRVCLSTRFGVRGFHDLAIEGTKGLMIFDDANSFIQNFEKIQNLEVCNKMELQGKEFILQHYSKLYFDKAVDNVLSRTKA